MPSCKFSPEQMAIRPEDHNATETAAVIRVEFDQSIPDRFEKKRLASLAELDSLSDDQAKQLLAQLK